MPGKDELSCACLSLLISNFPLIKKTRGRLPSLRLCISLFYTSSGHQLSIHKTAGTFFFFSQPLPCSKGFPFRKKGDCGNITPSGIAKVLCLIHWESLFFVSCFILSYSWSDSLNVTTQKPEVKLHFKFKIKTGIAGVTFLIMALSGLGLER